VSTRALAWLSTGVIAATLVGEWLLGVLLAWASGQSDQPAPSLAFDWRWLPLWLLPAEVLVVGLLVSVLSRRFGRGFRRSWTSTLGLMVASVFVFWLLYAATDQRVVRAVPPSVEDWSVRFLHVGP
jgi:ABC-type sulfate transport system permease component